MTPTPTPERKCCDKCAKWTDDRGRKCFLIPFCMNPACPCHASTPESRLREVLSNVEFLHGVPVSAPAKVIDDVLTIFSQEREEWVERINRMWVHKPDTKLAKMLDAEDLISKADVLALLKSKN